MVSPEDLRLYCNVVEGELGIELTWSEKVALSYYLESFLKARKAGKLEGAFYGSEAVAVFKMDYFGIQVESTDQFPEDDKSLREYCRRNVQFWREERTLI